MKDSQGPGPDNQEPGGLDHSAGLVRETDETGTNEKSALERTAEGRAPASLGASEVAAALGLNHFKRPIQLWLELTGRSPHSPDTPATEWGRLLEPVIRTKYAAHHSLRVYTPASVYRDGWMRASPDAVVVTLHDAATWLRGLEIKTAHWRQAHGWGETGGGADDIPIEYEVQCRWSMAVTGLARWDVAALIGGSDYREYSIDRNEQTEQLLLEMATAWWERHIVKGQEPTPDGSKAYSQWLVQKWPREHAQLVMPTERSDGLADLLRHYKREERKLQNQRAVVEQELRQLIGEFTGLVRFRDGKDELIRCNTRKGRRMVDWEAVAHEFAYLAEMAPSEVDRMAAKHTRYSANSRPMITPCAWLADLDGDEDEHES